MDKSYFLEYFELERRHWWFRARSNIIKSHITSLKVSGCEVLNIGAATGASSIMLAAFGKVTSIEYDADCCRLVNEKLNLNAINASVTDLPFNSNSFDLVCAFDVLEHVEDHVKAAEEMKRVCRHGGTIVCTVPAYEFLWGRHDEVNHHKRRYTSSSFTRLFSNQETIFVSYFNTFLFPLIALLRLADKFLRFNRKDSGSDFSIITNRFINNMFFSVMNAENVLLKQRISFPFGVSLLFSCRKEKHPDA